MADNTTLNLGSGGDVISTDDIGGVKTQIIKVAYGPLDTAQLITDSVGLPVEYLQPTPYTNFGVDTTKNIKNSAGVVYRVKITNKSASVVYFQLHNKATAPAGTDVPLLSWPVPAGTTNQPGYLLLGYGDLGYAFSTGIGFAISTTLATFTDAATASNHDVEVGYL